MSRRFLTPPQLPSGTSLPSTGAAGALFFKSDEAKIYVHNGTTWVVAQGSGGGGGVVVSATAPADPDEGTYWFDSTTAKSYIYYDNFWVEVGDNSGGYIVSETAPANPSEGDVWFSTSEGVIYVYYDSFWVDPTTGGAAGVPTGGIEGQVLTKSSDDDYDTTWASPKAFVTTYLVRNNTGVTIPKGTLVSATGAEPSGRIDVAPFETTGQIDSELRVMGLATANISNGVNGEVISFGTLTGVDTRGNVTSALAVGDETWAAGDLLFAHPTVDGKLTKVRPQHDLAIAFITVRHGSTGQLAVRIVPGNFHLEWLHDVSLTEVAEGETLVYNSATGLWENGLIEAGSSTTVSETAPTGPEEGDTWFKSSTGQHFIYYDSYWVELGAGPQGPAGVDGTNSVAAATAPITYDSGTQTIGIDQSEISISASQLSDVTASATELNYVDGVTSSVQTQLNSKASTGKAIAMAIVFG